MQRKDSGFFGMGKAVHERAVLKNQAWKMAQVKGPVSNFFPSRWFSLFPSCKLGKFPKVFINGSLGEDKARLDLCGTFLGFLQ